MLSDMKTDLVSGGWHVCPWDSFEACAAKQEEVEDMRRRLTRAIVVIEAVQQNQIVTHYK